MHFSRIRTPDLRTLDLRTFVSFALLSLSHCWHSHSWLRTGVVRSSVFCTVVGIPVALSEKATRPFRKFLKAWQSAFVINQRRTKRSGSRVNRESSSLKASNGFCIHTGLRVNVEACELLLRVKLILFGSLDFCELLRWHLKRQSYRPNL